MSCISIKKNPNRKVRNPGTGEELVDGKTYTVEDSINWRRRIQSGDVTEVVENPKNNKGKDSEQKEKTEKTGAGADEDDGDQTVKKSEPRKSSAKKK